MADLDRPSLDDFLPGSAPGPGEDFKATAGEPLEPGRTVASEAEVIEALHTVYDPEIPVDIYELGLIYELDIKPDGDVAVVMSLTAPGCPVAGEMPGQVAEAVARVEGIGRVEVRLTWDPAWTPERMSEDARLALGMF
jgi:FeS assembly SUF system protein